MHYFTQAAKQNYSKAQYFCELIKYENKFKIQDLSFIHIPENYISFGNQISDCVLKRMYSKFNISYLPHSNFNGNMNKIENYLFNYFKDFKFITYQFTNSDETFINKEKASSCFEINNNLQNQKVNIVFCVEGKCNIIEKIEFPIIKTIINKLKEQNIQLTNVSINFEKFQKNTKDEYNALEEIIINNFIEYTIRPIVGS